ncbi:carboxymuconolactone decarboxylase family protein [Glycomyces sp. TRM65418]|uniref:carboxymuconolactone decarboxylase family protein n=1 Tax=Glycomyces sp. TRM65418 TaxID=2867006 RepID=UPI001CE619A4|nr:carboxymuconolactone decarboxylase family protein [Glycomyces sp. TRM65418]MCC3764784.1 carboxymuconolactone decarboxylase family protein [Glycomyces sp. TRM65418]QZD54438.1 carboxymuconolactone decarboxylase family protein [Glycomyces sp. TRM65418]
MPPAIRHVTPVDPRHAEGLVAAVYGEAKAELGVVDAPFQMLSPAPELLAATWALLRESLMVGGPRERVAKEVVATAIAVRGGCRFCTDAHAVLLHALGESALAEGLRAGDPPPEWAPLAAWALEPGPEGPFPAAAAPRFIGTALVFEFITRLVQVLARNESPHPATGTRLGRSVASRTLRAAVSADLEPGTSLRLLEQRPGWARHLPVREPGWAAGSPVGVAYGTLRALASSGPGLLGADAAEAVARTVGVREGRAGSGLPQLVDADGLEAGAALGARLAVAAALSPGAVDESDVEAWRGREHSDHCVVHLLAYGTMTGVDALQDEIETRSVDA